MTRIHPNAAQPSLPATCRQRRSLLGAGVAAGLITSIGGGLAAPKVALAQSERTKVMYGQGSIDPIFTAGYVALKKGFFGAAGLDVEYLNSQSGPRTNQ